MRIGILTGGGDVPGLNACIRSITLSALDLGWEVVGCKRGWNGLLALDPADSASRAQHLVALDRQAVRGIDRVGGTMLHTSRTDPRTVKEGDRTGDVLAKLKALGIDVLCTMGGDGTLRFSAHLSEQGFPVISIPKTMDNDVFGTDYCIGFSTAVSRSVEAINALRTTAASHERLAVVELFGRRSGETALLSGFLAQVDRTLISEVPVDLDRLSPLLIADKQSNPENYAICVVSEGASLSGQAAGEEISKPAINRNTLGIGRQIARELEKRTGFGTIVQELAYLMRSGTPDAMDRMVGFAFGALAVQLIKVGHTGRMIALSGGNYTHVPIDTLLSGTKVVDVAALYDIEHFRASLLKVQDMPMFLY
ncbi:MAG: ATP-dependent 6-phosphofructokinase [Sphingomonadales bacterium]|jgi:6-phosphofructokinase|uniref:6-phosphofructokinase n=1 Tax=Sphingorhabdus sp. TaxID=1902408 RepID=UPI003BB1F5E7|nr:ATP-dependent 6-phosphofructokinase [Sphingomonadales bacterium]MBK9431969.1 ATP-dependent 6-phosphofructokinase [Sphingomonadales bacterium]MBL0022312.1 ATP-dependent 6-phosphofructokinase [Sphingomonadales bacterium]